MNDLIQVQHSPHTLSIDLLDPTMADQGVLSRIQADCNALNCRMLEDYAGHYVYSTKDWISLSDFLTFCPLSKEDSFLFVLSLLEKAISTGRNKPVLLRMDSIFVSPYGDEFRFVCLPLGLEHWLFQADEFRNWILDLAKSIQPTNSYEVSGYLLNAAQKPDFSLPSLLNGLYRFWNLQNKGWRSWFFPPKKEFRLKEPVTAQYWPAGKMGSINGSLQFSSDFDSDFMSDFDPDPWSEDGSGFDDPSDFMSSDVSGFSGSTFSDFPTAPAVSSGSFGFQECDLEDAGNPYTKLQGQICEGWDLNTSLDFAISTNSMNPMNPAASGFGNPTDLFNRDLSSHSGSFQASHSGFDQHPNSVFDSASGSASGSVSGMSSAPFHSNGSSLRYGNGFGFDGSRTGETGGSDFEELFDGPFKTPERARNGVSNPHGTGNENEEQSRSAYSKGSDLGPQRQKSVFQRGFDPSFTGNASDFLAEAADGSQTNEKNLKKSSKSRQHFENQAYRKIRSSQQVSSSVGWTQDCQTSFDQKYHEELQSTPFSSKQNLSDVHEDFEIEKTQVLYTEPDKQAHLEIEETSYELSFESISIGRHAANDIVLKDPSVSSHHARIVLDENGWFLEDLDSTNGSWLNHKKLVRKMKLYDGMEVQFGKVNGVFYE